MSQEIPGRELIADLIRDPENTWPIVDKGRIKPELFREAHARAVFKALLELREQGQAIDKQILSNQLGTTTPAAYWVWELPEGSTAPEYWSKQLIAQHQRELLGQLFLEGQAKLADPTTDLDLLLDEVAARLNSAQDKGLVNRAITISQFAAQIDLDRPPRWIATPWPALNNVLGGLRPGSLYVVGAGTGIGKSMFGQQLALAISETAPAIYYSLEMTGQELAIRALAAKTKINAQDIDRRILAPAEKEDLKRAGAALPELYVIPTPGRRVAHLRASIRQEIANTEGRLSAVFVDYLQLLQGDGSGRYEMITGVSQELKSLAIELDLPIVALAQFNRAGAAGEAPELSDIRDSGSIEQDADAVILLWGKDQELNLRVAKNRQGKTARLTAKANKSLMTISEMVEL
jgi:replicative DNA helicase